MKLLVIVSFQHYEKEILTLFKKAEIPVFSKSRMSGYKGNGAEDLSSNWFSATHDEYEAVMFFAFTEEEKAKQAMALVTEANTDNTSKSKIRGFIMEVESAV